MKKRFTLAAAAVAALLAACASAPTSTFTYTVPAQPEGSSGYTEKPGWVRLNFSVLLDDAKADRIIAAVDDLARNAARWAGLYQVDPATSRFTLRPDAALARIA